VSKFVFKQSEDTDENIGKATYYDVVGEVILIINSISFVRAIAISNAINKAERTQEIEVKKRIGDRISSEAYD